MPPSRRTVMPNTNGGWTVGAVARLGLRAQCDQACVNRSLESASNPVVTARTGHTPQSTKRARRVVGWCLPAPRPWGTVDECHIAVHDRPSGCHRPARPAASSSGSAKASDGSYPAARLRLEVPRLDGRSTGATRCDAGDCQHPGPDCSDAGSAALLRAATPDGLA